MWTAVKVWCCWESEVEELTCLIHRGNRALQATSHSCSCSGCQSHQGLCPISSHLESGTLDTIGGEGSLLANHPSTISRVSECKQRHTNRFTVIDSNTLCSKECLGWYSKKWVQWSQPVKKKMWALLCKQ